MKDADQLYTNYLGNLRVYLSPEYCVEKHVIENGNWELHVVTLLDFFVKRGFVCIDVGANTGLHTLRLAQLVGDEGRVIAFEPSDDYRARMNANINANPSLVSRVEVVPLGVSDSAGCLKLFHAGDLKGNAYMAEEYNPNLWNSGGPESFEECRVTTLDAFVSDRIDLIKIDVEGMESRVVKGALMLLKQHKPYLIYESLVEEFDCDAIQEMERIVKSLGYFTYFLAPELGKLVEVSYPKLPEDVFAIPKERLLSAVPIIFNAVQYDFSGASNSSVLNGCHRLSIVGLENNQFAFAWHAPTDYSAPMSIAVPQRGSATFQQCIDGSDVAAEVCFLENKEDVQERPQCEVSLMKNGQRIQLTGEKIGGVLSSVRV